MQEGEFRKEYGKLNAEQKEAVDAIEGPVMVIAGPGTGKTTVLTLRIANILRKTDVPPSGILALTFTDSGVKSLKNKLRGIIGQRAFEVPVHTFHSFARSVISEFEDRFCRLSKSKQITEIEVEKLLRQILKQNKFRKIRPLGDPDFYIPKIIAAISESKQEAWTPEMLRSFAREEAARIERDPASLSKTGKSKGELKAESLRQIEKCERTVLLADVYEEYERIKAEERKMDYDDLIFELLKALKKDEILLRSLQERYIYLLIDEHQDTNSAQNSIVRRLADFFDTPNLFVVGDEKQAIYRFQGASVENFLSFQKKWAGMKTISLSRNYRSHQHILDASFSMIEKNYGRNELKNLRVRLKSGSGDEPRFLEMAMAPDKQSEDAYLVSVLKGLADKEKNKTVAIIARRNSDVAAIFSLLGKNGLPASAERGANIFSHPVGLLYFSLLEFLRNPDNYEALAKTFAGGLWNLEFEKQAKFIKQAGSGNYVEIEKTIPEIKFLQKEMARRGALDYLIAASDISGFTEIAGGSPLSAEVWRGIVALSKELVEAGGIESPSVLIEELLAYKKLAERRTVKINSGSSSSQITVMTAHGSKGLEFDYVFLPYCTEESWMTKKRSYYFVLPKEKEEEDDIRDERRLFYVALTRAKRHVLISLHDEDGNGRNASPLRFLDELDGKYVSKIEIPWQTNRSEPETKKSLEEKNEVEKKEYAKNILLENGLSVTALNHFLECPLKFFHKSILRLPESPNASSEKGSAMHEALAQVWKQKKTGSLDSQKTAKTIADSVKQYFKKSFLSKFEKEAALEELLQGATKVAEALSGHFNQQGKASVEFWVEAPFTHKMKKETVEIKLHGKLDAVVENEDKVSVYDYKTREAMSVNAIRGNTKNNDGNYFRQLVFYKLLLEESKKCGGKDIEPALVFVRPDKKGKCPTVSVPVEKKDVETLKKEISNLLESVWSGKFLNSRCDDPDCEYCRLSDL